MAGIDGLDCIFSGMSAWLTQCALKAFVSFGVLGCCGIMGALNTAFISFGVLGCCGTTGALDGATPWPLNATTSTELSHAPSKLPQELTAGDVGSAALEAQHP